MNDPRTLVITALVLAAAGSWWAWEAASHDPTAPALRTDPKATQSPQPVPSSSTISPLTQGQPLQRYQSGRTLEERREIMGAFMSLGHVDNRLMLITTLADTDAALRMEAVQYAASLIPEDARDVYARASLSQDKDVREMAWSLAASHPIENRAIIYGETLEKGDATQMNEALAEMGRTPEKPLFEIMLRKAISAKAPDRSARLFRELQDWLKPGGGSVPAFNTPQDLQQWWAANAQRYDTYLLRVDQ